MEEEKYIYKVQLYYDQFRDFTYIPHITKYDLKLTDKNYICNGHRLDRDYFNQIIFESSFNDSFEGIDSYVIYCYKKDIKENIKKLKLVQLKKYESLKERICKAEENLNKLDVEKLEEISFFDYTKETKEKDINNFKLALEKGEVKF
jgi:hypothetical protein